MFKKLFIFTLSVFLFLILVSASYASTFYLAPGSANIPSGSTVSVSVGLNTGGESINGISAYLNYPSDKLEVTYASCGGSFGIAAERSYGGGSIRISCGSISGASGNVTAATIGLKGKAQGTATVSFVAGSAAARTSDSSDSLNLGGSSGGVYTIGVPKPASITTTTTPTPAEADTTKPVITNVLVSSVSTNTATIIWQTDEKADSSLEYGLNPDKYFLTVTDKNLTTEHSLTLDANALIPGTLLHFRVKSKDEAGNEAIGEDATVQLKGYNIKITVIDKKNKPVQNGLILLYPEAKRGNTDVNGDAYFLDVTSGKHLIVVRLKNGLEKTDEINVVESSTLQKFTLIADLSYKNNFIAIAYIAGLVLLVGVAVVMVVILRKRSLI